MTESLCLVVAHSLREATAYMAAEGLHAPTYRATSYGDLLRGIRIDRAILLRPHALGAAPERRARTWVREMLAPRFAPGRINITEVGAWA